MKDTKELEVDKAEQSNRSKRTIFWRKYRSTFYTILAIILLRGTVAEAYFVPTGSMQPTIEIGDRVLATKFDYGLRLPFIKKQILSYASPKRGDTVVFTRPDDPSTLLVKRVIGLPGDTIQIVQGQTYLNGEWLSEPYIENPDSDYYGPVTVPAGKLFMMGDNRADSRDSRAWEDPFVAVDRVYGKARYTIWNQRMFSSLK